MARYVIINDNFFIEAKYGLRFLWDYNAISYTSRPLCTYLFKFYINIDRQCLVSPINEWL